MSNDIDFLLTPDEDNADEEALNESYKKEIIGKVIQFVGMAYLVYGIFIAYIWTSKELDVTRPVSLTYYFWDPVITVYSISNMVVFAMILLNKYWTYNSRPQTSSPKPDNYFIVCVMLIPLFIASVVFHIIELIRDMAIIPCHGYMVFLAPLSTMGLITGAAILMFDVGYFRVSTSDWRKEIVKSNIIYFTVVGILNCLVITVSMQHMNIFRAESKSSSYGNRFQSNDTCISNNTIARSLDRAFRASDKYLRPTYILFCVCTLAYLIQPVLRHKERSEGPFERDISIEPLMSLSEHNNDLGPSIKEVPEERKASYRLPSISLVLCIIFLSLSLLGFIITYSLRQGPKVQWQTDLGGVIYCSFISVTYVIGSGLSVVHITEIRRWPYSHNKRGKIIDKCLIWVGAGGQLTITFTFLSNCVVLLASGEGTPLLTSLACLIILSCLLMTAQTFLQTIQIGLLLDRVWIRPKINSLVESLCPAVGLMGLNMGLLLLSVDQLKSPIINNSSRVLFVELFTREMRCVGDTLAILQRLHASLLFASMIVYTHN